MDYYGQLSDESSDNNTSATFTIDGGSQSQLPLINWNLVSTPANTPLFQSGPLPDGQHNLTVVYNGNATTVALALQSVIFQTSPSDRSSTNITRASPASQTASSSSPSSNGSLKNGDSQVVRIVAGVSGSLVALVGVVLILLLFRRQRNKRNVARIRAEILNPEFDDRASVSSATIPTPFSLVNQQFDSMVPNTSEMSHYVTKENLSEWTQRNQITPHPSNHKIVSSPPEYVP